MNSRPPFAVVFAVAVVLAANLTLTARQLKTPAEWKWRLDAPAGKVVDAEKKQPAETFFVAMPPGWHVTTGPATVLYHPDYQTKNTGNFAVEAEIFLFPGDSQEEYGVFLGGKGLGASETPSYLSFVARRDGQAAVLRRQGPPVVAWKANDAVAPHSGKDESIKNVLRVEAGATEVVFSANGKEITRVPRSTLDLDGYVGFRFGPNINVHASRLDITHKLAPVPIRK